MPHFLRLLTLFLLLLTTVLTPAIAEENNHKTEEQPDPRFWGEDGNFDVSGFLKEKYGFFVMPMVLTSPALGVGGGLNFIYLHDKLAGKIDPESGRYIPPSMSGATVIGTENGTRFGGAFHVGFYQKDTLRTSTFLGVPDVNLNFYPNKNYLPQELKVEMNLQGYAAYQDIKLRAGNSNWFLGGDAMYVSLDTKPTDSTGDDRLDNLLNINSSIAAFSLKALYDTRNSVFTPDEGLFAQFRASYSQSEFGNISNDYWKYNAKSFYFHHLNQKLFMGYRIEGSSVDGSAPFYNYPYVDIRGIPAMRYQGQSVLMGEIEAKYMVTNRFSAIFFLGTGSAAGDGQIQDNQDFSDAEWYWGKGLGMRYTMASEFKMDVGFDYAFGPEDNYFYLQFGSAWNGWF